MPSVNEQPIAAARPVIAEEEIEAAVRVLRSGRVVQGPEVAAFEEEFSDWSTGATAWPSTPARPPCTCC